jgi:predicted ATPase
LLVLDNCEHVIEAAATLAVAILRGAVDVHILATSREPLRVEGEHVERLSPLSSDAPSGHLGAAEALAFPAIELFVERTAERLGEFELTDEDAPFVAEICRKLDGIPLAIELAAARVETFGVRGLASRLDDRFRLLTGGRRSDPPRHRTLRATLDWSCDVLSEGERAVLRRLGIFMGGFTLDAACAVATDPDLLKGDVINAVAELVEKSLVVVETTETEPRLRLLETTRVYALEKLAESSERAAVARRHAEYFRELLETAPTGVAVGDFDVGFTAEISNIRASLLWAFSGDGDPRIAVAVATASAQLWLELSLLAECHDWTSKALALLTTEDKGTRREMVLLAAFGISLRFTTGLTEEAYRWLTRALDLAEQFNDADYKLRIFHVLCTYHAWRGDLRAALAIGRRCEAFAAGAIDPSAQPTADRMLGIVQFFLGDLASARTHLQRALERFPPASRRNDLLRFGVDQRLNGLSHKSDTLWLQGLVDQALQLARTSLAEARTLGHPVSLCNALVQLAAISLRVGDIETSVRCIEELHDQAVQHALDSYNPAAVGLSGQLSVKRRDVTTAVRLLRAALDKSPRGSYTYYALYTPFATDLALAEAKSGHVDRGRAAIDEALQRIERNEESWYLPEALRIKGELFLLQSTPGVAERAEDLFRKALDKARRQEALSWELRAATSLARLLRDRDRIGEARDLLAPIYGRFTEGFGTADLREAKRLIDALP